MPIKIRNRIFSLETRNCQYAFGVGDDETLCHIHWGRKIDISDLEVASHVEQNSNYGAFDFAEFEYSGFGGALYRETSIKCEFSDAVRDTALIYDSYELTGDHLKVILKDRHYNLTVELNYTVYEDIISRNAVIRNTGEDVIVIQKAYSAEFSLPGSRSYRVYNDNGTWYGENQMKAQQLDCGTMVFESRKGTSAHGNRPAVILARDESEDSGKIYFAMLEYSGNFKITVSRDGFGRTGFLMGVNDFDFECRLKNGESFEAPTVHFGYAESLSEMSNNTNTFALKHVFPLGHRDRELPVLYNSWEATGFNVNVENQKALAEKAKALGVELFVVDDGWFGRRNNDQDGLGDWYVNRDKFPRGLQEHTTRQEQSLTQAATIIASTRISTICTTMSSVRRCLLSAIRVSASLNHIPADRAITAHPSCSANTAESAGVTTRAAGVTVTRRLQRANLSTGTAS